MIAKVAVSIPYSDPYDYLVPERLKGAVCPGVRVLVPLGARHVIGTVVSIVKQAMGQRLKDVLDVVDPEPVYSQSILEFTHWMAEYYICSWAETLDAAIPGGIKPKVTQQIQVNVRHDLFPTLEQSDRELLLEADQKPATFLKTSSFRNQAQKLKQWKSAKLLEVKSFIKGSHHGMATEDQLSLIPEATSNVLIRKGSKAERIVGKLREQRSVSVDNLKKSIPHSAPVIRKLIQQGAIEKKTVPVSPQNISRTIAQECFLELNREQALSFKTIQQAIRENTYRTFLLSGVTGSGKTEVYLHAVKEVLQQQKSALILIPEISLTPQAVKRFQERFGDRVAVLHSGMTDKERASEWWKIKHGACDIVIGARSAIFAPLENIGLIVVDEEHDASYKQQEAPFYNARDAAVRIASKAGAVVILGSATPSIESFYNARIEKYYLLELKHRANLKPLPQAEIISLKHEKRQPGIFYLSTVLVDKLKETLAGNKQVLVFLNRRGFAAFLSCKGCDLPVLCRNCSIAMTWHKTRKRLICHHCGQSQGYPSRCDTCGETSFRMEGIGTQRIEQDLGRLFPGADFLRMDRDTIQKKGSLEKSIELINDHKVDFVVGTQLVSKGHDFKHIGMVCIVLADMSLNFPDFRSSERSFQLISQVSGRAGRDEKGEGSTLIQTYNPEHFAITSAIKNDYLGFFQHEIDMRQVLANPPFTRLVLLKISSLQPEKAQSTAKKLGEILKQKTAALSFQILGPIEAPILKINQRYYWQILLKTEKAGKMKQFLRQLFWDRKAWQTSGSTRVSIDVDPFQML